MACICPTNAFQEGANSFFSRYSGVYARRFRRHGLERMQKLLLRGIPPETVRDSEILDIGCGVGALHLTLLKEGAARAVGVDMSEGMIETAKQFSVDLGVESRAEYVIGDFVEVADSIRKSDVTLLDKSVCCYEDIDTLVRSSTAKTKAIYALSHPRQNLFMELAFKGHIFFAKLFRWKFHPFWHDWRKMREDIRKLGFALVYSNATPMWQVLVFKRI
ncbi:MAG TPA: methyltransferase domain-containing protein [Bacteroidota bacterium]